MVPVGVGEQETGDAETYLEGSSDGVLRTLNKGGGKVWKG